MDIKFRIRQSQRWKIIGKAVSIASSYFEEAKVKDIDRYATIGSQKFGSSGQVDHWLSELDEGSFCSSWSPLVSTFFSILGVFGSVLADSFSKGRGPPRWNI